MLDGQQHGTASGYNLQDLDIKGICTSAYGDRRVVVMIMKIRCFKEYS